MTTWVVRGANGRTLKGGPYLSEGSANARAYRHMRETGNVAHVVEIREVRQ